MKRKHEKFTTEIITFSINIRTRLSLFATFKIYEYTYVTDILISVFFNFAGIIYIYEVSGNI